jgi:hypothetical protein
MPRKRNPRPQPPTPQELKALIDQMDWAGQNNLLQLFLLDPKSEIGKSIRAYLAAFVQSQIAAEQAAGYGVGQVDPEALLTTDETEKEAMRRLGKPSIGAVKQAKHRAKQRLAEALKSIPPIVSVVKT